jgi:hypothetical protein
VLGEEALQVLLGFLRPLTGLHGAEGIPKLRECGNGSALFRELARVLGDILGEVVECLVLRLRSGSESLLLLAAHTLAVRCSFPDMEVADPNFPLAGALDFFYPALRRVGSGQAWSNTLDRELPRRDESGAFVLQWCPDFGFSPTRHDCNVHGRGSSGKSDLGG